MLSATFPLLLLVSAFIVICCDPELRDAEPVAGKRAKPDDGPCAALLSAAIAAFG